MFDSVNITIDPEIAWTEGSVILLFSPVTVIGNGFVLASILLDPFKNISSPSSNLIFNLAFADVLVGILTGPLTAVCDIYMASNNTQLYSSNIQAFTASISVGVSLCTLIALSVDRRIAITTPLQYNYRVTKSKVRNVNICIWIYCMLLGLPTMVFKSFNSIFFIISGAHTAIVSVVLAVLNIVVIRSVRTQAMNINRTVDSLNLIVLQNAFNREKAVTRITIIMVVAFEIYLFPFVIRSAAYHYSLKGVADLHVIKKILWVSLLVNVLVFANSLMNPFLYAWRLPKYRKAFQYILSQIKNKVFISAVQPEANTSRHFGSFQDQSSVAKHKCMVSSPKIPEPHCSGSVKNIEDDGFIEITKL